MPDIIELPDLADARARIERTQDDEARFGLMYDYLICGRASEVVAKSYGKERCYGPSGKDLEFTEYEGEVEGTTYEAVVFNVKTAKRKGTVRKVALPLDPKYEPWAAKVADYFKEAGSRPVFPFTRQEFWSRAKPQFKGLMYPIDAYQYKDDKGIVKTSNQHGNQCALHWLRHLRATELVSAPGYPRRFRFDVWELAYYGGWTVKGLMGMGMGGGAFQRYVNLPWEAYFPKLLRDREKKQYRPSTAKD